MNLYDAIREGDTVAVQRLLSAGFDLRYNIDRSYNDHLNNAIRVNNPIIVEMLLDYGVEWQYTGNDHFDNAILKGNPTIVQLLLDFRVRRDSDYNDHLASALRMNDPVIVRMLLDYPYIDPTVSSNDYLALAIHGGKPEIVQMVLDHGVRPSSWATMALYLTYTNNPNILEILNTPLLPFEPDWNRPIPPFRRARNSPLVRRTFLPFHTVLSSFVDVVEGQYCPICHVGHGDEDEDAGEERRWVRTVCGHVFCRTCLERWLTLARPTCPYCRRNLLA